MWNEFVELNNTLFAYELGILIIVKFKCVSP